MTPYEAVKLAESMTPDDHVALLLTLSEVSATSMPASRVETLAGNDRGAAELRTIGLKCANLIAAIRSHAPAAVLIREDQPSETELATIALAKVEANYGPKVIEAEAILSIDPFRAQGCGTLPQASAEPEGGAA